MTGVTREASAIMPRLRAEIAALQPDLARVCAYHFGFCDVQGTPAATGGGKLMRAGLVTASARSLGLQAEEVADLATAVELLHNSTLLHDDIIDRDTTRRGRPTAWTTFGFQLALLAGDALQVAGLQAAAYTESFAQRELAELFSESIARVLAGQSRELTFRADSVADIEEFERIAVDKTSSLLECSLGAAALRADAPRATVSALRNAGYHLGIAWQASNDVEDIWGDPTVTGKPACGDLRQRTLNLPVLEALSATGSAAATLREAWHADDDTQEHVDTLVSLIAAAGGRHAALQRSQHHLNQALHHLNQAEVSQAGNAELSALFHLIVNRSSHPDTNGPQHLERDHQA